MPNSPENHANRVDSGLNHAHSHDHGHHGHAHSHDHGQVHAQAHAAHPHHHHAPGHAHPPVSPPLSVMRMSLAARLLIAALASLALWVTVLLAMRPGQ